ncbi:gamma-glutamyltransferase [Microbacterium sp.]|uniref:gamma-glutamyltransferase n=2 Tax=Microbacterium sp. TaxID=51671 RepID=UPI0037CAC227
MAVAVAAPHMEALAAGERAVREGGNALDAALAAAAMLTVVYPHQCALGGDLIALVRSPQGHTTALLAVGTAPAGVDDVAGEWSEVPRQGPHAVTVPGMLAGWRAIEGMGARRGLRPALAEAAEAARRGSPVSAGLARALASRADAVLADRGMREVFAVDGRVREEGESLTQPALAATLSRLAEDPEDFYRGTTAAALVEALGAAGGTHATEDFAAFQPEVVDALTRRVGDRTWSVAPPPSVGAVLLGVVAHASTGTSARPTGSRLVDAAVRGVQARGALLGDPRVTDVDVEALLSLSSDAPPVPFTEPRPLGDTAAVTALDDEGWGVTIVQSVYQTFGSGLMDPQTGILFHNRGSAFSVDPASPAVIRSGARPPHTLCPAIVESSETLVVAGCQGGRAQPWILAQLLPAAADPAQSLDEILARPRWIVGDKDLGQPELSLVAEAGVGDDVRERAAEVGLPVVDLPGRVDEAGHVQIVRAAAGGLQAASDPRADGSGVICG